MSIRDDLEFRLAKLLSRDLRGELKRLLEYLGDPPNLSKVPDSYWKTDWKMIAKNVEPVLVEFFIQQALDAWNGIGAAVELSAANSEAVEWARQYGDEIIIRLYGEHHNRTSELIAQAYTNGWTTKQLTREIEINNSCSSDIAETIAATEMTRAQVEGEKAMERRYFEMFGEHLVPIWLTANDEERCDFCAPRENEPIIDGIYPPAHPRCRCNLSHLPESSLSPKQREKWINRPQ